MLDDLSGGGVRAGGRGKGDVVRYFLAYGFLLWMVATVVLRLFGRFVFSGDALGLVVLFVLTVPAMALAMYPQYARKGICGQERLLAAVCAVLPGMVLDVLALAFFGAVYPDLPIAVAPRFGALLMWAYALILLTGFLPVRAPE